MNSRTISYNRHPHPINISEYIRLKEVRANTALIDGQIVYNGKVYSEKDYLREFPEPKLEYQTEQLDKRQISHG